MSDKYNATFHPNLAPSSPGVTKLAQDLCGRDTGRQIAAIVQFSYLRRWPLIGEIVSVRHWSDRKTSIIVNTDHGVREGVLNFTDQVTVTGTPAS